MVGHNATSPEEIAVMAQLYRHPFIEYSHVFFVQDGKVIRQAGWTLNQRGATYTPRHWIKRMAEKIKADKVFTVHNHPSGSAEASGADIRVAKQDYAELGELYGGEIIIDSGKYGLLLPDGPGKLTKHRNIQLTKEQLGWDPALHFGGSSGNTHQDSDFYDDTYIHPNDPLYPRQSPEMQMATITQRNFLTHERGEYYRNRNPITSAERRAGESPDAALQRDMHTAFAAYASTLKVSKNWTAIVWENHTNRIAGVTEYQGLDTLSPADLQDFIADEGAEWGAYYAHVIAGPQTQFSDIAFLDQRASGFRRYAQGIRSAWVDNQPVIGMIPALADDRFLPKRGRSIFGLIDVYDTGDDTSAGRKRALEASEADLRRDIGEETISGGAPVGVPLNTILDVPEIPTGEKPSKRRIVGVPKAEKYTPRMKMWLERTRRAYMSGNKNLSLLGELGEHIRRAADKALDISDRGSNRDLRRLEPHQRALVNLVNARTPKGADKAVIHAELSEAIYRFIEDNTPIDDAELLEVARGWKETWREMLKTHDLNMMQLRKEVASLPGEERIVIRRADGSAARQWHPILPAHTWDEDAGMFKREKDGAMLSIEDAIDQSDRLYLPHMYPSSHWNAIVDQVNNKIIQRLDKALKKKGNTLPGFTYNKAKKEWTFTRTQETFTDKKRAVDAAKDYWTQAYAIGQQMLAGRDSGVIGRYGHLEVERQTADKLYQRDVSRLFEHTQQVWKRIGEITAWGQYDPILGNWPRLAQYTGRIAERPADMREYALWTVADTLMSDESMMFERLSSFSEGESTAADIMRYWNTPDLEKMRAENQDRFDDETMQALVEIGMAQQNEDGTYQLAGDNEVAQRSNFIRHMVPYFQTLHLREETVLNIARGIGHWQPTDTLNTNASKVWSALNHITTTMTLGLPTAIQNLGEVPLLASLAGSEQTMAGLQRLATDPEFRQMLPQLGAALNKARDYMTDSDVQAKYLEISLFTPTERWSRLAGVAVGWETAKNAIANYLDDGNPNNRKRLEELNISVEKVEQYKRILAAGEAPDFDTLVDEAEDRTLEGAMMIGGLRNPNAQRPSNIHVDLIGDEMGRAARYVSVRVFKGYNALTMPDFLNKSDPMIRTFFKFKSWAAQMHEYMWSQFNYARKEARKRNFAPAWRLAQGMAWMGLSGSAIGGLFAALSGRADDEENNRILESLAMTHTLGIGSMIVEIAMYSDGNPYRAANLISSAFGSPTAGVAARISGSLLSGDPAGAAQTTFWQLPGVRDARRLGLGAILKEDE